MQGPTVLFVSPNLTVETTDPETATAPPPFSVPLMYEGPDRDAVAVEIHSQGEVLAVGGTVALAVEVSNSDGSVVADPPLSWTVDVPSVVSVSDAGVATGLSGGRARGTVVTSTGLSASIWFYVFER